MNPQGEIEEEYDDEDYDEEGEEGEIEYVDGDDMEEEEMEGEMEEDEEDDEVGPLNPNAQYIQGLEPLRSPAGGSAQSSRGQQQPPEPWKGLAEMPSTMQKSYKELLEKLQSQNKSKLTILLVGKSQVGKSSLINKLLNEKAVNASFPVQPARGPGKLNVVSREAAGFTLTLIDTPGLPEDGSNTEAVLRRISAELKGRQVDAVLYVDRLDNFRVDAADKQNMEAISDEFGSAFWNQVIVTFTHARITSLPDNLSLGDLVHQRGISVRSAIRKASGNKTAQLPEQAAECGWKCDTDNDGVQVLPNGTRWLSSLMSEVVNTALTGSWKVDKSQRRNSNRKFRRWIPLVLAAQLAALKWLVIDRVLAEDGVKGDQWGPYDEKIVRLERRRRAQAKEQERAAKSAARSTVVSGTSRRQPRIVEDDDDFDDL